MTVGALVVRYAVVGVDGAAAPPVHMLKGATSQGHEFDLLLASKTNYIFGLRTSLEAGCSDGGSWRGTWSPVQGHPVIFIRQGAGISTHELTQASRSDGTLSRVGDVMRGRIVGGTGEGTLRLVVRVYTGAQETYACDSGDLAWAVGPHAQRRLSTVARGRTDGSYYPAVPSLAGRISRARQRFIARVDGTCTQAYRPGAMRARQTPDDRELGTRLARQLVTSHSRQLIDLSRLGPAPQAGNLYREWLANIRQRMNVEREALLGYGTGTAPDGLRVLAADDRLTLRGNAIGQRFGLQRCTATGPDRTPVALLSDGLSLALP